MSAPLALLFFVAVAYAIYFIANRSWESSSDDAENKPVYEYTPMTPEEEEEEDDHLKLHSPIYSHLPRNFWFDPNE